MMKTTTRRFRERVVVFTGSGVSAPSGLATFRSAEGVWSQYPIEEVSTPDAWRRNPAKVLEFYNLRRKHAADAEPNAAHHAIAALEERFDVVVVTQNVDDLHERAGSENVVHLHGELRKARSSVDPSFILDIGAAPIRLRDCCPLGSQMRPHIVWFGEPVPLLNEARRLIESADRLLVAGTSLGVYPAAGLVQFAGTRTTKVLVDPDPPLNALDFQIICGSADVALPPLVDNWIG
jgi:NAD-dependent deacetylase